VPCDRKDDLPCNREDYRRCMVKVP
jgi:hypothetical protein